MGGSGGEGPGMGQVSQGHCEIKCKGAHSCAYGSLLLRISIATPVLRCGTVLPGISARSVVRPAFGAHAQRGERGQHG
eukprot:3762923-Rhodomonas_salina.1